MLLVKVSAFFLWILPLDFSLGESFYEVIIHASNHESDKIVTSTKSSSFSSGVDRKTHDTCKLNKKIKRHYDFLNLLIFSSSYLYLTKSFVSCVTIFNNFLCQSWFCDRLSDIIVIVLLLFWGTVRFISFPLVLRSIYHVTWNLLSHFSIYFGLFHDYCYKRNGWPTSCRNTLPEGRFAYFNHFTGFPSSFHFTLLMSADTAELFESIASEHILSHWFTPPCSSAISFRVNKVPIRKVWGKLHGSTL